MEDQIFDEMLDIVDGHDRVIKTLPRSQVYQENLCSQMRSVWLMIKNDKGQLWIPRRSWTVALLPGHLDGSVVGHVRAGETYEKALHREALEEVGCDMSQYPYQFLGKLTPHEHNAYCFASVYECHMQNPPTNWNRDDIAEWYWMTPQEILRRCEQGEKHKNMLPIIVQTFYQL